MSETELINRLKIQGVYKITKRFKAKYFINSRKKKIHFLRKTVPKYLNFIQNLLNFYICCICSMIQILTVIDFELHPS